MIFNKIRNIFFILNVFFISSCALEIGEPAPPAPDYYLSTGSGSCSQLDYKKVFIDYFFTAKSSNITQAFNCISVKIVEIRDLIKHEFLSKQETTNILNQDFIKTKNMEPIIDNILDPKYFDEYIFIKNSLIQLIDSRFQKEYLSVDEVCKVKIDNENIISKEEVDILIRFLGDLSVLFSTVEDEAQFVFQNFFKRNSIESLNVESSSQKIKELGLFLSEYLSQKFPSYAQFLKNQINKDREAFNKQISDDFYLYDDLEGKIYSEDSLFIKKALLPLLSSLSPLPSEDHTISPKNIKYMLLNIYIIQAFFQVYDLNQDFTLSSEELKSFSCLITPLVSVLISPKLEEKWKIIQQTYNPIAVSHYLINYQEIPPQLNKISNLWEKKSWRFFWYRIIKESNELDELSYTELSRLISLLFSEFFNKIQFEEL